MDFRGERLTFGRIARFVKNFIYTHKVMNIYEMDIDATLAKFQTSGNPITSQIEASDLEALMLGKRPPHLKTMQNRLKSGELCFVAKIDDEIMGYIWVRKGSLYFTEIEYEIAIKDDAVWVYDELTLREWRGRGIQQQILSYAFNHMKGLGYKKVYVGILSDNEASLRAHAKFGFNKLIKEIKYVKIFGLKKQTIIEYGN